MIERIRRHNRYELRRNHYYWHYYDGIRYGHYYDSYGYHWYGFYNGSSYYWARYHNDHWWWYEANFQRWVYWNDGYWWYQDPLNLTIVYVYIDDSYYRYDRSRGGVVLKPEPPEEDEETGATVYLSDDGTRMVEISGSRNNAFLFNLIPEDGKEEPEFMAFLGANVAEVRFSHSKDEGVLTQILIVDEDGAFALFDPDGNPYGAMPTAEEIPENEFDEGLEGLKDLKESIGDGNRDWGALFDSSPK